MYAEMLRQRFLTGKGIEVVVGPSPGCGPPLHAFALDNGWVLQPYW